jgi:hypothetical protein
MLIHPTLINEMSDIQSIMVKALIEKNKALNRELNASIIIINKILEPK